METKPLLYGLIGFFLGGLLVSVAATTFNKPSGMAAGHFNTSLAAKSGDDYDKAFLSEMIVHHEGALDMAELSNRNAKHPELKELSRKIMLTQAEEIELMKHWQEDWGYATGSSASHSHPEKQ